MPSNSLIADIEVVLQTMYRSPKLFGAAKWKHEWVTAENRLAKRSLLGDFQMKAWKKYNSYPKTFRSRASCGMQEAAAEEQRSLFHKGKVREESLRTRYGWEIYNKHSNTAVSGIKECNFNCVSPARKGDSTYRERLPKLSLLLRNCSDAEAQGVCTQMQSDKVSTSKRHSFCPHLWGWFPLHLSNRLMVPCLPPSYAAIKLSSQNVFFLTVEKLPVREPLLRR